ncbi:tRNA lysidine(34) synthetase TilS [Desulfobotulus sp. H1]|uniref:tRNA(Ile)-lysidine synthase n=1 Tax=Desulfobotulus pelophilus TaxID=2823377 RepID=A0ABT3N5U4_9BACT|nr:tRNA lysidine(34) synthetase TilS [Desulfobotulus pelophilus]MCW7752536.1 tRNA lysidine(34) synthetase TilS [Desulfobotulus pelophilus]
MLKKENIKKPLYPPSPFLKKVLQTIREYSMWPDNARVLIAVSGGADSMALLHALMELCPFHGASLGIAHLHHGLRPEASEEETFVADHARTLALPFHSRKASLSMEYPDCSTEEAGRMARYAFFDQLQKERGYTHIATAHHADDRAEQVLMNLIRGCGPDGLEGIPPIRRGVIVRPLIHMQKSELIHFLMERGIPWKEDSSNKDTVFLRNRIRHKLLPFLEKEFNPSIRRTLLRTAAIAENENQWLENTSKNAYLELLLEETSDKVSLRGKKLSSQPPALQARILRHALCHLRGNLQAFGQRHLQSIQQLLHSSESVECHLPGRIRARYSMGILELRHMPHSLRINKQLPSFSCDIALPKSLPATVLLPNGFGRLLIQSDPPENSCKDPFTAIPHTLFPLIVRVPLPGDRMRPSGRGGSRKIFRLLSESFIPKELRRQRPVIIHQEAVIWVPGLPPDIRIAFATEKNTSLWLLWQKEDPV